MASPFPWYVVRAGRLVAGFPTKAEAKAEAAGGQVWARGNLARLGLDWRAVSSSSSRRSASSTRSSPSRSSASSTRSSEWTTGPSLDVPPASPWVPPEAVERAVQAWQEVAASGKALSDHAFKRHARRIADELGGHLIAKWREGDVIRQGCIETFRVQWPLGHIRNEPGCQREPSLDRVGVFRDACAHESVAECASKLAFTLKSQEHRAMDAREAGARETKVRFEADTAVAVACLKGSLATFMRTGEGRAWRSWVRSAGRSLLGREQ